MFEAKKKKKRVQENDHLLLLKPPNSSHHCKLHFFGLWDPGFIKLRGRKRGKCIIYSTSPFPHQKQDRRAETVVCMGGGESLFMIPMHQERQILFCSELSSSSWAKHSLWLWLASQFPPQLRSWPGFPFHRSWSFVTVNFNLPCQKKTLEGNVTAPGKARISDSSNFFRCLSPLFTDIAAYQQLGFIIQHRKKFCGPTCIPWITFWVY